MKIKTLTLTMLVLSAVGCNDVITTTAERSGPINPKTFGIATTDSLFGLLIYRAAILHLSEAGVTQSTVVQGFFADSDSLKSVTSAKVNDQFLTALYEGQYILDDVTVPNGSSPTLSWEVTGFLGSTFSKTYDLAKPMSLTSFGYLDTVDASAGASIGYSGSYGSGELLVTVSHDKALSESEINPDSTTGGGYFVKKISDGGTITLSPSDLSSLTPYRVYMLEFTHDAYNTDEYQGAKVGHYTSYSVITWFVLVP